MTLVRASCFATALFAAVGATPFAAGAEEVYFTLGLARGGFEGAAPAGCTLNDASASGTGGALGVGYRFSTPFALEFGWQSLGALDLDGSCPGPVPIRVSAPDNGLAVSGVGRLQVGSGWALLGRLGAYSWSAAADSGTEAVVGVGAEYEWRKGFAARFEYTAFGSDLTAVGLGLRIGF